MTRQTARELALAVRSGERTATAVVEETLAAIGAGNSAINAFIAAAEALGAVASPSPVSNEVPAR